MTLPSWTNIPDFVVGQTLTASRMNEVRDNLNVGHTVCTSTTRPSSPVEGTMIYETDTDKVLVWTGAAWVECMTSSTTALAAQMPVGSIVQVARHAWTNETSVNGSGAGWVTATGSSATFTPLFASSRIWIVGELAMAPYYGGASYAGMSCRITWRGNVVTVQGTGGQTHEVYVANVASNADLYSRTIKTAWTPATSATAGTITTQVAAFVSTSAARLNQNSGWESSYTILEIRQ
jgi:hypothetical protein